MYTAASRGSLRQTKFCKSSVQRGVKYDRDILNQFELSRISQVLLSFLDQEPLVAGAAWFQWGLFRLSQGGDNGPKLGEITAQAQCQRDQKRDRKWEQRGMISEHQHGYISSWLLYRGYIRDILKDMIEGASESCSTLRFVVKALRRSVKSRWQEPEAKGKEENSPLGDRLMKGAEWTFVCPNAEKWPNVINMTEQLLDHFSNIVSVRVIPGYWEKGLSSLNDAKCEGTWESVSFWFLSIVYLAFSRNTTALTQTPFHVGLYYSISCISLQVKI